MKKNDQDTDEQCQCFSVAQPECSLVIYVFISDTDTVWESAAPHFHTYMHNGRRFFSNSEVTKDFA